MYSPFFFSSSFDYFQVVESLLFSKGRRRMLNSRREKGRRKVKYTNFNPKCVLKYYLRSETLHVVYMHNIILFLIIFVCENYKSGGLYSPRIYIYTQGNDNHLRPLSSLYVNIWWLKKDCCNVRRKKKKIMCEKDGKGILFPV